MAFLAPLVFTYKNKKAAAAGSGFLLFIFLGFMQEDALRIFSTSYTSYCKLPDSFPVLSEAKLTTEKFKEQINFSLI